MLIKILPVQVPEFWDAIKFAASKADGIAEKDLPPYLTRLLAALLNGKAQCFLRLDDERHLLAIGITRIIQDEITGDKSLFFNSLYSFQAVPTAWWVAELEFMTKFAKQAGCKRIVNYSNNKRVFEIVESVGFTERYRCHSLEV